MLRIPAPLAAHVARRRTPVAVLSALYAGAAALLALSCLFPLSPTAPVTLGLALLPVGVLVAGGAWLAHQRLTDAALLGLTALLLVLMGVLLAAATTPVGVIVDASGFGWVVAYVALLFPRHGPAFAALAIASIVTGVVVGGVGGVTIAVVVVTTTIALVTLVLSHLSVAVQRTLRTDPLTGTLNRAGLADAWGRVPREDAALAVLDLDAFKAVNDDLGHLAGDRLLAESAAAWLGVLRRQDVLARTGGDEFVLVMPRTTPGEARTVVQRLRDAHPVAFSAGYATIGSDVQAALERADQDLYRAKAARHVVAVPQPV
jgi:diguanylate cyclase (GGDEF)-like protein